MIYILYFILGWILYTYIEYWHHRAGGHYGTMGDETLKWHQGHHKDPMDDGLNLWEHYKMRADKVLKGLVPIILITVFIDTFFSLVFCSGVFVGYLYSEYIHYCIHHRPARNFYERLLWKHHYIHHHQHANKNYGFTFDVWDRVHKTLKE